MPDVNFERHIYNKEIIDAFLGSMEKPVFIETQVGIQLISDKTKHCRKLPSQKRTKFRR